jgi:NitT/TauT family transport system permease protein
MAHLEENRRPSTAGFAYTGMKRRLRPTLARRPELASLVLALGLLVLWELGVRAGVLSSLHFPEPSFIGRTLAKMVANGELVAHMRATLLRMLWGILLGCGPGLVLGLVMGWSMRLRGLLDPFVAAAHPLPKIALLPLIMVIFGVSETSLVIVAATGAFFPILINTMAGVQSIPPLHFEVARSYGANRRKVLRRVVLPGSLPSILTGLRLAANVTLLVSVAVEMISARQGLGALIWMAWNTMRTEEMYVSLLVITGIGVALSLALRVLSRWITPWNARWSE